MTDDISRSTPRREVPELREAAEAARAAGDYRQLRVIDARIVAAGSGDDAAGEAQSELEQLRPDPAALGVAGLGLLLWLIGWMVAL